MGQNLEREVRKFDWKDWAPIIGLYYVPRKIFNDNSGDILYYLLNGSYHGLVIGVMSISLPLSQ